MSKFSFDDLTRYATYIKAKLAKNPVWHKNLRDILTRAYQGLYFDFGFDGHHARFDNGNIIKSSQTDVEKTNGEMLKKQIESWHESLSVMAKLECYMVILKLVKPLRLLDIINFSNIEGHGMI